MIVIEKLKEHPVDDKPCYLTLFAEGGVIQHLEDKSVILGKWKILKTHGWQTGTPTEEGLYVVLTKVSMEGVSSSEGTYILDYWDGYSFQYLRRKAMVYLEPDTYGWVAWQRIELYKEDTE